jgi:hypothetical protein
VETEKGPPFLAHQAVLGPPIRAVAAGKRPEQESAALPAVWDGKAIVLDQVVGQRAPDPYDLGSCGDVRGHPQSADSRGRPRHDGIVVLALGFLLSHCHFIANVAARAEEVISRLDSNMDTLRQKLILFRLRPGERSP